MTDQNVLRANMLQLLDNNAEYYPHFLDQHFPHVLDRLIAMWGKPQFHGFLEGLLAPAREGSAGFPEQALKEINEIRNFCSPKAKPVEPRHREAILAYLDFDQGAYPQTLETEFPDLFRKIAALVGSLQLEEYLDSLLATDKQFEHRFSETVLIEIMTLKSIYRAQRRLETSQFINAENAADHDHVASVVFDRVQRW